MAKFYDYIIAGGGCSGLSLAWHITREKSLKDKSVLIIDPVSGGRDDKTWCFWADDHLPEPVQIFKSWRQLRVVTAAGEQIEPLGEMAYHCVRGRDYFGGMRESLEKNHRITFLNAEITSIQPKENEVEVTCGDQKFRSGYAFQSFGKPDTSASRYNLKQHFLGWEIKTQNDVFDSEITTFMDFGVPQTDGAVFVYILPFSAREALVEFTVFSREVWPKEKYIHQLKDYLKNRAGIQEYEIIREESGEIPMADGIFNPGPHPRFMYTGTRSGIPKASTGYAFSRIHRQSAEIARQLGRGDNIRVPNPSRLKYRIYDRLMLDVISNQPDSIVPVFTALFRHNPVTRILRFLDEKTTFTEDIKVMLSVPRKPFLRAILRNLKS